MDGRRTKDAPSVTTSRKCAETLGESPLPTNLVQGGQRNDSEGLEESAGVAGRNEFDLSGSDSLRTSRGRSLWIGLYGLPCPRCHGGWPSDETPAIDRIAHDSRTVLLAPHRRSSPRLKTRTMAFTRASIGVRR